MAGGGMTHDLSGDLLQVFEASVEAMLIADAQGRVRRTNGALRRLFGLPEMLGDLRVNDLVPESLRARHDRQMHTYQQAPKSRPMSDCRLMGGSGPLHARRLDGTEFPAEISLSPLPQGRVLAIVHDISARVEAESKTRQWSERYARLLQAIPDIVVELDAEGVIKWANAVATRFFGDDPVGQALARFRDDRNTSASTIRVAEEGWFIRADGQRCLLTWSCSELEQTADRTGGRICSARDVTERNRSEELQRNLSAQMRQIHGLQIVGQTVRKIAHDLNQPLNAVSAYAAAALRLLDDGKRDPAKLSVALQGCCEESERAGEVMRKLMRFLDADTLKLVPIDLGSSVGNVVHLCKHDGYADIGFEIDLASDLWRPVGNPRQIESVLHSLITNSVEAVRLAGVAAPLIRVEARNDAAHQAVQITLSDNGPGLDAQIAEQAFSPFFTTRQRAVGLGLTISRALVEASGGELWYDGGAGPGATFRFTILAMP